MNAKLGNLKNFNDSTNELVFVLNKEGLILTINQAVQSNLGYFNGNLVGQSYLSVYPEEFRQDAIHFFEKSISGKTGTNYLPFISKSGFNIPVESQIFTEKLDSQEVIVLKSQLLSEAELSHEKFLRIFEENPTMMAVTEQDSGVFVNINKAFSAKLGYRKDQIIGHSVKELELYDEYSKRSELIDKLNQKTKVEYEHVTLRDQNKKPLQCLLSVSKLKCRFQNYLLISVIDISTIKQVEEKLKEGLKQETLLSQILQNVLSLDNYSDNLNHILEMLGTFTNVSRVYIFEDSINGHESSNSYEWCNTGISPQIQNLQDIPYDIIPSFKKILEEKGRLVADNIEELPVDICRFFQIQHIKSILIFPLYLKNKYWGFIGFDECVNVKSWKSDEIQLLSSVSSIISGYIERLFLQKQLRESEIRQKLAFENAESGLWDWDIHSGEVIFNEAWAKMLGYTLDELKPDVSTWQSHIHPDDVNKVMEALNNHLSGKTELYESPHRLLTKSGEWKWILDKGKVVEYDFYNKPKRVIGAHTSIENQKKYEEKLIGLNATKDKLFSIIAHDLRGPIGTLLQISELLANSERLDEETIFEFRTHQQDLSKSTYQLLENLLNWSRFNLNQINYNPQFVSINEIIEMVLNSFLFNAKQKNIKLLREYSQQYEVFADEGMTTSIVRNLLSNAIKFTNNGGFVRIGMNVTGNFVEVRIANTGKGITDEAIKRILSDNDFFTSHGTANEKGSGIGLKLCKNFIQQNKGEFKIESQIDVGSTFIFTLPMVEPE